MELEVAQALLELKYSPVNFTNHKCEANEQKCNLQRDDNLLQNELSMCVRSVQDVKSQNSMSEERDTNEPSVSGTNNGTHIPHVIVDSEDSTSDDDGDINNQPKYLPHRNINHMKNSKNNYLLRHTPNRFSPYSNPVSCFGRSNGQDTGRSICSTPSPPCPQVTRSFKDQAIQTEDTQPLRDEMEVLLLRLCNQIQDIVRDVNLGGRNAASPMPPVESSQDRPKAFINGLLNKITALDLNNAKVSNNNHTSSEAEADKQSITSGDGVRVRRVSAHTTNDKMVPIGDGNTMVPYHLLNNINWGSHTQATRQLLKAIFPRRVLATHSLTGKLSPAFANKPVKKQLNPVKVNDIVNIVSQRCGVAKRFVRNAITSKCADEAKCYRKRKFSAADLSTDQENIPPETSDTCDDDSSNTERSNPMITQSGVCSTPVSNADASA